jgi:hypothetical protein
MLSQTGGQVKYRILEKTTNLGEKNHEVDSRDNLQKAVTDTARTEYAS